MTALDFARQYLFEPLGIGQAIWPTDPQGYNRGSGDLMLHPHDMAKLGYLWMNYGVWEGEQIVSRQWVEDSVKPLMEVGDDEYYGYGWWVYPGDMDMYIAIGRGGQRIVVVPAWNLMAVTTGGGFDFDAIVPLLFEMMSDMSETRPANPDGVAALEAAVTTVAQPPAPEVAALPDTAAAISGQTFVLAPNPLEIGTLGFEFNDSAEAVLLVTSAGSDQMSSLPIGMDGAFRLFPGNYDLPQGMRGYWADDQTFVLDWDEIANNHHRIIQMRFEGNRLVVEGRETTSEGGMTFEGRLQNP
jgi:hypothetical protein